MVTKKNEKTDEVDSLEPRRYVVKVSDKKGAGVKSLLSKSAGIKLASSADFEKETFSLAGLDDGRAIYLEKLGIAIVQAPPDQMAAVAAADNPTIKVRREREFFILGSSGRPRNSFELETEVGLEMPGSAGPPNNSGRGVDIFEVSASFLRGYYAGISNLINEIDPQGDRSNRSQSLSLSQVNQSKVTWGLQVVNAASSPFSGRGVRVAVLDTGIDLTHPDFLGRNITSRSFLGGVATAQDGNGHGTHCAGTVCGPLNPSVFPRYGVAPDAELFVGKVLSDEGSGPESSVLLGIEWALANKCRIISMSLGSEAAINELPNDDYEDLGRAALDNNCLIIAAAGNDSNRPGHIAPVGVPANSTTIMAVAAVQQKSNGEFGIARFSNGGINPGGGKIDVAGPGVAVYSSWSTAAYGPTALEPNRPPTGTKFHTISGTSMATPHVAGIAALFAEKDSSATADQIMQQLAQTALSLGTLPSRDVGSGLAQSPQS